MQLPTVSVLCMYYLLHLGQVRESKITRQSLTFLCFCEDCADFWKRVELPKGADEMPGTKAVRFWGGSVQEWLGIQGSVVPEGFGVFFWRGDT